MAHLQYLDELIREYLLFRGFTSTLKSFDTELKVDKDKGFRVDRIIDQFLQFIATYDLTSLRDLWSHMDQKMFSKLEHEYTQGIRKLESSLYKLYLVNAVSCNKTEKVSEFFVKMTPELQGQSEWKDWFMLPFVKNPEENPTFAVHFTKQWQDTLIVSLHNLLSIIYQEENEALKHKLATLSQCSNSIPDAVPPMDIMDDFYIIAQENPSGGDSHGKSLKNLIRTIGGGMPTSPIMGRKPHLQGNRATY
ncbi:hypothetical protein AAG570_010533 [Ranatra chinensis]|uniref:ARMC9 CTLH-like domain-containing protein n=1 Tax=Ranatra chinensis TaxID=642074 RepID=A0ABD0YMU9_9HEMI